MMRTKKKPGTLEWTVSNVFTEAQTSVNNALLFLRVAAEASLPPDL